MTAQTNNVFTNETQKTIMDGEINYQNSDEEEYLGINIFNTINKFQF